MPLTKLTSLGITDGTIVNADINASAAIDSTKISGLSSDFVLLATTDASNVASVSFDGYFSSTYKNYQIIISNVYSTGNAEGFYTQFRRSNANITTSNYKSIHSGRYTSSGGGDNWFNQRWNSSAVNLVFDWELSNNAERTLSCSITLYNPLGTTAHKSADYIINFVENGATYYVGGNGSFWLTDSTSALSGIYFAFSSNISSGTFKLYGIK